MIEREQISESESESESECRPFRHGGSIMTRNKWISDFSWLSLLQDIIPRCFVLFRLLDIVTLLWFKTWRRNTLEVRDRETEWIWFIRFRGLLLTMDGFKLIWETREDFFFVKIDFLAGQGYKPLRLYLNYRLHLFTWSGDIPFVYNGA